MTNDTMLALPVAQAIDAAIEADNGNLMRQLMGKTMPALDDAYRVSSFKFRPHMGASLQGNRCARAIWYSFNWYTEPKFPARIQRLYNRGHLEEGRISALLEMIGVKVTQYDANGKQFAISGASGHYGGSGDGVLTCVPGLDPNAMCLGEYKTHGDASYKKLVKEGMKQSKYEHYVQIQQYLYKMNIPYALYGAVNKNTDDLHWEYVAVNREIGEQYTERAERIVWLTSPPERVGNPPSPGLFDCRFCDHKPVCWQKAKPAVNCRTCVHSQPIATPEMDGTWVCNKYNVKLTRQQQETSCLTWEEQVC